MDETKKKGARFDELTNGDRAKSNLADFLGIPTQLALINNWRSRGVPASYAPAVAEFLGCSPEEISATYKSGGVRLKKVAEIQEQTRQKDPGSDQLTPQEQALIAAYRELQQENKDQANLVMQVAFGLDPRQQMRSTQQDKLDSETMAAFDPKELGAKLDAYYKAGNATEKIVAADRLANFVERRQAQMTIPKEKQQRASDQK